MANNPILETSPSLLEVDKTGLRFDNSYSQLPEIMFSRLYPVPVKNPKLIMLNNSLSNELDLNFSTQNKSFLSYLFSGNKVPKGSCYLSQAYAGHQFGYFTMLGDGRAILMGEHINKKNKRYDVQLKGSGKTPYSRNGDGRAALGPVVREYIISEAMHALNIPTTRSLAVVTTGEQIMRENLHPGAILTRVADSHIRVGTFQYVAMKRDLGALKKLIDYSIVRHFPNIEREEGSALEFLKSVMKKQIKLIVNWMRVGFVHGVMNTDNMAVSGETIDYGPCAFMDFYKPDTCFSSIDEMGRYAFCNQPLIANWNLSRLAETLIPAIHENQKTAIKKAEEVVSGFSKAYKNAWLEMMRSKLGLLGKEAEDEKIINSFLLWMQKIRADYTNSFYFLTNNNVLNTNLSQDNSFINWHKQWRSRLNKNKKSLKDSFSLMKKNNPAIIPRNHKVEEALKDASDGNLLTAINLINVLKKPYDISLKSSKYKAPPDPEGAAYKTFCGT